MPSIPGFEKTLTFTELLKEKKEVGDKVLFFGGGQSSCEAAYDLVLNFGKHPIIVEYAERPRCRTGDLPCHVPGGTSSCRSP